MAVHLLFGEAFATIPAVHKLWGIPGSTEELRSGGLAPFANRASNVVCGSVKGHGRTFAYIAKCTAARCYSRCRQVMGDLQDLSKNLGAADWSTLAKGLNHTNVLGWTEQCPPKCPAWPPKGGGGR